MKLKSKLAGRLCIIGVVAVILTAVCAILAFWSVFSGQAREDLRNYGQIPNIRTIDKKRMENYNYSLCDCRLG